MYESDDFVQLPGAPSTSSRAHRGSHYKASNFILRDGNSSECKLSLIIG